MPWSDINGVSIRFRDEGSGPVVVLLHEMGGCLESWDAVAPLLPGRRIVRYDRRGAGLSEKVAGVSSLESLVDELAGLLDVLGIGGAVQLAGVAVGAAVALGFAIRHPHRTAGVLAMAPATGLAPERRAAAFQLADRVQGEGMRSRVEARIDTTFLPRYRDDPARLAAFRGIALANDPASYAATYRMLAMLDMAADLKRIACPVLVVAGDTDATRPPEACAAVAAAIPGASFATVASGHVMPLLTPALVAELIVAGARQARSDENSIERDSKLV